MIILFLLSPHLNPGLNKGKKIHLGWQTQQNYKDLNTKYKQWINMVTYIAKKEEIKTFLQLPSTRDRDLYIKFFWQQRDPTPGTEVNEYKTEIENRFKHVNRYFKRGSPRPGMRNS